MMGKTVFYAILTACGLALAMLLAGFACWQLGWAWLAAWLYPLAAKTLLLAFGLFSALGGGVLLIAVYRGLAGYFGRENWLLRRLAGLALRQQHARQRLSLEKRQLHYRSQFKRQRLSAADDRKQSRQIFNSVRAELKQHLSPACYKELYKDLKLHRRQANVAAMLAVRERALCRASAAG